jgi:type III secretory pathway component EscV
MRKTTILGTFLMLCFALTNSSVFAQSKNDKAKGKEEKTEKKDAKADKKDTKKVPAKKDTILGNKVFVVEVINMDAKKGAKNKNEDVIEFKNNKLKSKIFDAEGYPAADYTVKIDSTNTEEKVYIFEAESKNEGEGMSIKWEGTWDGEEFSGSANKMKKDKPKGAFEFKGYEKSKKKK